MLSHVSVAASDKRKPVKQPTKNAVLYSPCNVAAICANSSRVKSRRTSASFLIGFIPRHGFALIKLQHFFFVVALNESHNVAVLIAELKHVRQLFDDGVAHVVDAMQDQCVGKNLEANRNAGGVRIENGVALNPEGRVLAIGINPDALQQLLGLGVFLLLLARFCRGFILTGNNTEHEYTTQHQQKRSGNHSFSYNKPIHSFTYLNIT